MVPFLKMIQPNPDLHIVYFHGNAEDIGQSIEFLEPIYKKLNANIYAIEYPNYGTYNSESKVRVSDRIKSDA